MKTPLTRAVEILKKNGVVAVPTETVYGLAAPVKSATAVRKIFALKKRPADNPLIVHVNSIAQLSDLVTVVPPDLRKLKKFWPGPLTVVLPAKAKAVPKIVRAGLKTVAVRIPDHRLMRRLIQRVGPLAAPSANLSGRPSPTSRAHVEADLGKNFPVLDGGTCRAGVESTVIALAPTGWRLLRAGALAPEKIARALGLPQMSAQKMTARPESPGQKYRHYAPKAQLIVCRTRAQLKKSFSKIDAVLGFSDSPHARLPLLTLGKRENAASNLKRLYAILRVIDARGFRRVAIDADFSNAGLGATLRERLCKAAGA